jgi:hypothetical protein
MSSDADFEDRFGSAKPMPRMMRPGGYDPRLHSHEASHSAGGGTQDGSQLASARKVRLPHRHQILHGLACGGGRDTRSLALNELEEDSEPNG